MPGTTWFLKIKVRSAFPGTVLITISETLENFIQIWRGVSRKFKYKKFKNIFELYIYCVYSFCSKINNWKNWTFNSLKSSKVDK